MQPLPLPIPRAPLYLLRLSSTSGSIGKCGPREDWLFTSAEALVSEVAPIASNSPKYSETVFLPQQESLPAEGGKSEQIKMGSL